MPKLNDPEITEHLKTLPGWTYGNGELSRSFEFPNFVAAFSFVTQIALKAEASGHHPDIDIHYNKVRLGLVSHDSGGVTSRDIKFAGAVNQMKP